MLGHPIRIRRTSPRPSSEFCYTSRLISAGLDKGCEDGASISRVVELDQAPQGVRVSPRHFHAGFGHCHRDNGFRACSSDARRVADWRRLAGHPRSGFALWCLLHHLEESESRGSEYFHNASHRKIKGSKAQPRGGPRQDPFGDFFDRFFDSPNDAPDAERSLGSGVIVDRGTSFSPTTT